MDTLTSDEESGSSQHDKGRKRRGDILEKKKEALIDTAQGLLLRNDRKESHKKINSFGLYVGEQLDQVETFQRQVAEKLISDVLFLAKTGNLNFESRVETTTRSRNVTFSRSSSSNISYMPQAPSYHNMIHASPSPHHYQTFPSPHFINQPSLSPRSTSPSPSPQYIQPSPSPHQIQPSPSPQTQHIQPSPSPHHIQTSSQHSQPSSSHHFQTLSQHMQAPPPPQNSLLFTTLQAQLPINAENAC
ncbi:E3 ubiquitin-protein ligase arkadia-C-like [Vanessa cardui]|uniref:E3 ubiquitin-protein ligase arkadia-C-like n=1 Tax=Vanessa cardui TaxID=171605 RepID=UPI001F14305F|nr:E3 ubiquitin-protein ligase arkadia-C-like [Vanessa cardui]